MGGHISIKSANFMPNSNRTAEHLALSRYKAWIRWRTKQLIAIINARSTTNPRLGDERVLPTGEWFKPLTPI